MTDISKFTTPTGTSIQVDRCEPPEAFRKLRAASLQRRQHCLPKITSRKSMFVVSTTPEKSLFSLRSTADGSSRVQDRNSIEIFSDLNNDTPNNRDSISITVNKNPVSRHRSLKKASSHKDFSELRKPNIHRQLSYLSSGSQNSLKEFEKKLKAMSNEAEEKNKTQQHNEENQDAAEQFRNAHLPEKAKRMVIKEYEIDLAISENASMQASARSNFSRNPRSLYTRKKTLKPLVASFLRSLPKNHEAIERVKEFISQGDAQQNMTAKNLADEVVMNYNIFKEKTWKNKDLRKKIKRVMEEEKILDIFNEKEANGLSLDVRIYMDMIEYRKLDELANRVYSHEIASVLQKSDVNLDSLCTPVLIEKHFHKYRRLNNELKDANFQNKVDKIETLQEDLVNAYKDFASRKAHLFKRLAQTDRTRLIETKAQCDRFESMIPLYEPDQYLSYLERFELRNGDFDEIKPETRIIHQKLNELLQNWNVCVDEC